MRLVFPLLFLIGLTRVVGAQSYLDKKDDDAIALITRTLAKLDKAPALFDGTRIAAGADLRAVDSLLHSLRLGLRTAEGAFAGLSAKGLARPAVAPLRAKYDDLVRYRDALAPILARASDDAERARRQAETDRTAAVAAAHQKCGAFRAEVQQAGIGGELPMLYELAAGHAVFWQTVDEAARYKAALERLDGICKRPAFADVGKACELASNVRPKDADACLLPARTAELLRRSVENLVAHHAKHTGPASVLANFEASSGWLDMDGVIGWTAYMTGQQLRAQLDRRIAPMLAHAGMQRADADQLFGKLASEYAALEAKVRASAASWDLPGAPCSGAGCSAARGFVAKWYRKATLRRFHETRAGWAILKNELGIPTYRERYGYALVQVTGEPLCQLRQWTLSEPYAGGGRYTAARDVTLGRVRWQTCK